MITYPRSIKVPTHEEQLELSRRFHAGDAAAGDAMQVANMPLVIHWAQRYQGMGIDFEDLVQEGSFGLRRAVEKFDPDHGFKFSTYATWWIRQSLQRVVSRKSRLIKIPEDVLAREREAELDGEIFEPAPRVLASLDSALTAEDSAGTLLDVLASDEPDPAERVATAAAEAGVLVALDRLEPFHREVIRLRFGLGGEHPLSMEHTAQRLHVGVRAVRNAELTAKRRLRGDPDLAELVAV